MSMPGLASGLSGLGEREFLPDVIQYVDRAKSSMDTGQYGLAMAYSHVVLHDEGLRVYVDFSAAPANQQGDCKASVDKALKFWNDTLSSPDALKLVDLPEQADVKVVFQPSVTLQGVQVGGYCSQTRSISTDGRGGGTGSYSATIFARFTQPNGRAMTGALLQNVVTHEFGHVFGLNDCNEGGHLMGPLNVKSPRFELNAEELESVRRLRQMAFDIQRNVLARSKGQ